MHRDFPFVGVGNYGKRKLIVKIAGTRRTIVDRDADRKPDKHLKPWNTPALRKFELTEDDLAQLRASDDPMALLLKIRPDIKAGN